jgi:hypothetical protein
MQLSVRLLWCLAFIHEDAAAVSCTCLVIDELFGGYVSIDGGPNQKKVLGG